MVGCCTLVLIFFFFNDTATTEIYTLSLHDALPICADDDRRSRHGLCAPEQLELLAASGGGDPARRIVLRDRKSTRLNSSHQIISYAVFCLKKKTKIQNDDH